MTKRATVYFGGPLETLTANLEGTSVSGRINRTAERYLALLGVHGLDLTPGEEEVLLGRLAYMTGQQAADVIQIRYLYGEIARKELKDTPDARSMLEKVKAAPFADLLATVEKLGY